MPILIKGSGGAGTQTAPTISVSSSGLITATADGKSSTKQLTTKSATTITPTTTTQTAVSAGTYVTGDIKVGAAEDPYLFVENPGVTYDSSGKTLTIDLPIWVGTDAASVKAISVHFDYSWTSGLDTRTMSVFLHPQIQGWVVVDAGDGSGLHNLSYTLTGVGILFGVTDFDFFSLSDNTAAGRVIIEKI